MENQTPFDLNNALRNWREGLSRSPQFRHEDLAELEAHLRDSIAALESKGLSAEEAMLQASRRRLRPIVMTALATVAGMLPLAFAWGAGAQMLQPLAIAVIGGVLVSIALSLLITPAVNYYLS